MMTGNVTCRLTAYRLDQLQPLYQTYLYGITCMALPVLHYLRLYLLPADYVIF